MRPKESLAHREIALAGLRALRAQRLRSALTAASMAAAVAAVVLVATVAATGSQFVLAQIQGVGSNLVYAYYEAGGNVSDSEADYIDLADVEAVRLRLGALAAAVAGVSSTWDSIMIHGRPTQIRILGSSESYLRVRNPVVHHGRFLERADLEGRARVCLVTRRLGQDLFGSGAAAVGQSVTAHGIEFKVIGVFSERVETYGQSEVSERSMLVPHTVLRYFQETERVDPLYVSVRSQQRVEEVAGMVRETLESRHRAGSLYRVETLAGILATARRVLLALSVALILVASITLAVSGVFIMNMMLIAVSERTVEIGIRRAVGASRREIRAQFVFEAMLLAAVGGVSGALVGVGIPWAAALVWPELAPRVPSHWVALALLGAAACGGVFGLLPAARAANLDPAEALRHD
ncbi:MAG: ABC transporter permease [Bryobacterales bacterium]|nr:ABC transporter permease [Bryobacterales bacterium]